MAPTRSQGSTSIPKKFDKDVPKHACEYKIALTDVTFSEDVQSIGYCAFRGCVSIEDLEFPQSMRRIGCYALCDCRGLKLIHFNEGLKELGDHALQGCTSLAEVELPKTLTVVGNWAFKFCPNLKEVRILGSPVFGENAFAECDNLERIVSMTKDSSSRLEDVIPQYMRRVEAADGDWAIVYERIKEPEPPIVVVEIEDDANTTVQSRTNGRRDSLLRGKTKQPSASRGSTTDDEQPLSSVMVEAKVRLTKILDEELLRLHKEHKKDLKYYQKLMKKIGKEREDLEMEVKRLRQSNKEMANKLQEQKKRGIEDDELSTRVKQGSLEDLQERMEQQRKRLADLETDKDDMRKDKDEMRKDKNALQRDKDKLTAELNDNKDEMKALQRENDKLTAELNNKDDLIGAMRESLNRLKRRNDELQGSGNLEESRMEQTRKKKRTAEARVEAVLQQHINNTAKCGAAEEKGKNAPEGGGS